LAQASIRSSPERISGGGMETKLELNARQRKHVYMHSTIFDTGGPEVKSVYAPSRQQELYNNLEDRLQSNNAKPPQMMLPRAGDIKCTQNAGHHAVLPSGDNAQRPDSRATPRTTGPEVLVYDGEPNSVVKAAGKDRAIPKEFWATSVNLQWHDTRNEQLRDRGHGAGRNGLDAQERKRQELSSEVFGKERLIDASTKAPRQELLAETADHLRTDSALLPPSDRPEGPAEQSHAARARLHRNLASSEHNTMPRSVTQSQAPLESPPAGDDPSNMDRRRQEKNFSDLFDTQMGERKDTKHREEITAAQTCSFLDTRSEIAARNKSNWRSDQADSPAKRKEVERGSKLFDFECPERPPADEGYDQVIHHERTCWDSKDFLQSNTEIARRRRMKDHLKDFDGDEGHTHSTRKQDGMSSAQVRLNMGGTEPMARPPSAGGRQPAPSPTAREELLKSAKDTKLASLQSSIFG